jgi:DNA helicase-2/ATP-dependent DNA helicase PcrA
LGPMFVGTIHSYCFHLLQEYIPHFGNYDVLDEHRHFGFLSREYKNIKLHNISTRHWQPIRDFAKAVDVIGNELLPTEQLKGTPLGECYNAYLEALERYHFLTFGLIISKTIEVLGNPEVYQRVHSPLKHLIVDEYQDINTAQERLIELLSQQPVQLCVVGDDDQSIYQWRGSDINNILMFSKKRKNTEIFKLEANRRSRPDIVRSANTFAQSIPKRLEKVMGPTREGGECQVIPWTAETEIEEANIVAKTILLLHEKGYRYQDIAILYRSVRTSAPVMVAALDDLRIPYSCGGRTGLFIQPEINLFGEIFAWFVGADWKDERFGPIRPADLEHIVRGLNAHFNEGKEIIGLKQYLEDWRTIRLRSNRPISLVGDFYKLLNFLNAHKIDINELEGSARFGAFARFSQVLADFEHVTRRGRYVNEDGNRVFRGGRDRGKVYYQRLHNYLIHYARDAYEDFEGETTIDLDAVDIMTVHQAKGLEWPIVFLPGLTHRRFPSSMSGRPQAWILDDNIFPEHIRKRYEGGDSEERRLFYVAFTRARDTVYLSYFNRIIQAQKPSPYLLEVAGGQKQILKRNDLPVPATISEITDTTLAPLEVSFTDVANFDECPFSYRLNRMLGFQIELAVELGYGRALHHVLRHVAESARRMATQPEKDEIEGILSDEFYLPFADNPTFERMHRAAGILINKYLKEYSEDLRRIWEIERPFEVHLENGTLAGRADVILDREEGRVGKLAIVDYKTATDPFRDERYHQQLAVYAAAGRGEGLDVVAGYLHELKDGIRKSVDVSDRATDSALNSLVKSIDGIRKGIFNPCPEIKRCTQCDYRLVCKYNSSDVADNAATVLNKFPEKTGENEKSIQGKIIKRLLGH